MVKKDIYARGSFSERKGIVQLSDILQVNSLNSRTRNKLFTAFQKAFYKLESFAMKNPKIIFVVYIYTEVFSLTHNDIPQFCEEISFDEVKDEIYEVFHDYEYNEIFDFIEGAIKAFQEADNSVSFPHESFKEYFIVCINEVFKTENVNYQIINSIISDIVDENEKNEINETLVNNDNTVGIHFSKAIEQLYKTKDYENSIKESISAVEAKCQIITKNDNATLSDALKTIDPKLHPALKQAFLKLYAYTSDANGIRHANGIGEGNSSFIEAKYMLVSCSAFINYLDEMFK